MSLSIFFCGVYVLGFSFLYLKNEKKSILLLLIVGDFFTSRLKSYDFESKLDRVFLVTEL